MSVRVRPAATVMLVRNAPHIEVLMLRRTARAVFAGDMWVYPGGAVDPSDATALAARCDGIDPATADAELAVAVDGLGYWVAAARECFEEAGVLFAPSAHVPADRLDDHRRELNAGRREFSSIVHDEGLRLDLSGVVYVAHWCTPLGPPRRFDTRFFLAALPDGQTPAHDDGEAVHHQWIRPVEAIERWRAEEMSMMTPTIRMLMCLAAFDNASEALAAARRSRPFHQVRTIPTATGYDVLLPGDHGWENANPDVEFGWVGLRPG